MTDLLFLAQEPIRLFMYKAEYKYSYLSLLSLLTTSAADRDYYYKHLSIIMNSILQSKTPESDQDCIVRFVKPFS